MQFRNVDDVVHWLTTTKDGRAALRECLPFLDEATVAEILERNRTTYVVVKVWADGWVEVFGDKTVRVKAIVLPVFEDQRAEGMADQWVDLNLSVPFQRVHYPSNKRAAVYCVPYWSFAEFAAAEHKRELELAVIRGINGAKG